MEAIIDTFHIDLHLIIAQVVNFALVVGVVYMLGIKPLMRMMHERSHTIKKGLEDAQLQEELLDETRKKTHDMLVEARAEVASLMRDADEQVNKHREGLMMQAQLDSQKLLDRGHERLQEEKEKMLLEARQELAQIVVQATRRVLDGRVTLDIDTALVETSLQKEIR